MIESVLLLLALTLSICAAGFFAGAETGFLSVSRVRLLSLVRKEAKSARRLAKIVSDMPNTVTTLLVGNNIAAVLASTIAAHLALRWYGDSPAAQSAWSTVVALVTLYCGEYLPKLLFASRPLRRSMAAVPLYEATAFALSPVVAAFSAFARVVFKVKRTPPVRLGVSRDGLRMLVADRNDATRLTAFERRLIENVLTLQAHCARDLAHPADEEDPHAVHRLSIPASTRGDDILPIMRRNREPTAVVYEETTGARLGIVTEEDVLSTLLG